MKKGGELTFTTKNIVFDHDFCDASVFEVVPGNYIEILVKDTGSGMNADVLEKIFEPFFTTKDSGQGTGLGLASVYGTVQDHCGVVDVESSIGVGTVFHVYLPISTSGVEEIAFAPKKEFMPGTGKIILIDDEEIIRITGSHMLEEMGYKVATFENGLDAIETFRHQYQQIDLVITDMIMPEINGKELFYKLREIDANCKVIISSGFARNENIDSLKRDGLSGFINKPFTDVELSQLLVGILKNG